MARVRGGNTGYALALVTLGAGFVITLLVAIIFYTQNEAKANEATSATAERRKFVSDSETGEATSQFAAEPGESVYSVMRAKIDQQGNTIADLERKVRELESAADGQETAYTALAGIRKGLDDQLAAERAQFAAMRADLEKQLAAAEAGKAALEAQVSALNTQVLTAIGDADAAARDRIATLGTQVQERDRQISQLRDQLAKAQSDLKDVMAMLPQAPVQNTTTPDGQVTSIFSAGNDLFINIGRSDGLVIGMTFEVFDPNPVIRLSEQGAARGKATIEVYAFSEDGGSATCRVVRKDRGEQIDPGDPVVNIAYDPNKTYQIFPYGYFDIEGDAGPSDLSRVKNMITGNGGKIPVLPVDEDGIPQLNPFVDYLVLGEPPVLPEAPGNAIDPEVIAAYQAKLAEHDAYYKLVDEAKLLRIPVLNQNRFLDLVGYYVR